MPARGIFRPTVPVLFFCSCVWFEALHQAGTCMRSSIEINDTLLRKALKATGLTTKRAVVEEGLRLLIRVKGQGSIRRLRGKIDFDGHVLDARVED
jgi:Arc/MetJ family transcription regulator